MSLVSNPTTQFVLDQFDDTYEKGVATLLPIVSVFMDEWPAERPTERYTYLETVGGMSIWRRGSPRSAQGFRAVSWTTDTWDWQVKCEWHRNDDQDHQGRRKISQRAMSAAAEATRMPIRLLSQVVEGATDNLLLPAIPNAPDGAAMYATTAAGVARFGATDGNSLTGSGTTGQAVQDDWFSLVQQWMLFETPSGFPLFDPGIMMTGGVTIMYPPQMTKAMAEAFRWARPMFSDDATLGSPAVGAATTNRVLDFNIPVTPLVNPYLTDVDNWYAFLNTVPEKPLYRQVKQPLMADIWDRSNSDQAKNEKIEAVGWDARWGIGVGPAFGTIKVTNT